MKVIKTVEVEKHIYSICDCCNKDIKIKDEVCEIDYTFGYSSLRDGDRVSLDLCSDCLTSLLGEELLKKGIEQGEQLRGKGL